MKKYRKKRRNTEKKEENTENKKGIYKKMQNIIIGAFFMGYFPFLGSIDCRMFGGTNETIQRKGFENDEGRNDF